MSALLEENKHKFVSFTLIEIKGKQDYKVEQLVKTEYQASD